MSNFINLKKNEVFIKPYRFCDAIVCDLDELLFAIEHETGETLTCSDADAAKAALEDGEYLATLKDISQETIEELYYIVL